jgi:hypothetical protein
MATAGQTQCADRRRLTPAPSIRSRCIHAVTAGQTGLTKRAPTSVVLDDLLGHQAPERFMLAWLMGRIGDRSFPAPICCYGQRSIAGRWAERGDVPQWPELQGGA